MTERVIPFSKDTIKWYFFEDIIIPAPDSFVYTRIQRDLDVLSKGTGT